MIQVLLGSDGPEAMSLSGALLDLDHIIVHPVSDSRTLLDRLNEAPTFYHLVVLSETISSIFCDECVTVIRRLHDRLPILVIAQSPEPDRIAQLGQLGVRKRHILPASGESGAFVEWIKFTIDDLGLKY